MAISTIERRTSQPAASSEAVSPLDTRNKSTSSPVARSHSHAKVAPPMFGKKRKSINRKEMVHITSQLAIMTKSGVDIVSALASLQKQSKSQDTIAILSKIHSDVVAGATFSQALSYHSDVFGQSFVASVTAGEASGKMSDILAELASLHRNELKLIRSIKTMAAYPLVLVAVSCVVITSLLLFVLPQFSKIFDDFDAPLPMMTIVLIAFSNALVKYCWIWAPALLAFVFGGLKYLKTQSGKRLLHTFLLNAPVLGDVTRSLLIGRVCRLLGLLINSGVTLLDSLKLVRGATNNLIYREMLEKIERNVLEGKGLGRTLENSPHVPDSAAEMIQTAERTGTLGNATQLIGGHFEEEGEEKLRAMIVVLEPAVTVVMGAVVAFVVLAVALPMFDLANVVQN